MLRNIIGPVFNFRNCVFLLFLLVFQKIFFFLQGEWDFQNKKKQKMDQFLTLKRAKIGPVFNFTAYIYIYICTHTLQSTWRQSEVPVQLYTRARPNPSLHPSSLHLLPAATGRMHGPNTEDNSVSEGSGRLQGCLHVAWAPGGNSRSAWLGCSQSDAGT